MQMIQTQQQTSFNWETATPRERDIWIAEHVMGERTHITSVRAAPHYTSDPADDLSVLHAMRGRDPELIEDYFDILVNLLHDRWRRSKEAQTTTFDCSWLYPVNFYEVGDYSHAAWLTLRGR